MPAKKSTDKPEPKKFIDVSAPGKSAPDSTSRPVIVSHRPMIEDPMVAKSGPETPSAPPLASKGKIPNPLNSASSKSSKKTDSPPEKKSEDSDSIVPVKVVAKTPNEDTKPDTPKEEKPATKEPESKPSTEGKPTPASPAPKSTDHEKPAETSQGESEWSEKSENEGDVPGMTKAAEERKKAEAEAAKKAENEKYERMISEKTYFAPIDTSVSSSGSKLVNVLLFLLLLALVGGILAIDAGLLDIGIDLPFDLIKQ